ncbi:MAG TPA: single-stranded DNA-binding protein [Candidatus Paceibacterota bacterium]|nr:single-stranded DNA-binding protein [Candidatus Paceibacterota bacterium]
MANVNKVFLIGNLTADPVLRESEGKSPFTTFSMALNRRYTTKEGEKKEEACFVDCKSYGKNAININKYFHKGRPICVEGRLYQDKWEEEDGKKRNKLRIICESFSFIDSKNSNENNNSNGEEVDSKDFDSLDI